MAKKEITAVDEKIPSIETPWTIDETHAYSGARVEELLKEQIRSKAGFSVIPQSKQDDGFFHVWGFSSEEDYDKFLQDPEGNSSLLLYDNQIPISTDKGVSYSARLTCSEKTTNAVISIENKHETGLRFNAILNDNGVIDNAGVMGTLTFQRSTDKGLTWTTVGTDNIISRDQSDTTFDTFDIGKYFTSVNPQQIRVRASFTVYDDDGKAVASAQSAWVTWSNIIYTQLIVENRQDWTRPIMASDGVFPLSFAISGEVDKYLHVTVSGSTGTYSYVELIPSTVQYPSTTPKTWTETEKTSVGILTHGVHTVTAWLTCDDGSGSTGADGYPNGITSETVTNRFMVVNESTPGADLTKPYLILQQVKTEVTNYVRTVIGQYAVWNPSTGNPTQASGEPIDMSIKLTDASDTDTDYTVEYMSISTSAVSLTAYSIDTTVEIESTTGSEQVKQYLSYLRFFRISEGKQTNFLYESIKQNFVTITVDNSEDYSPVAGAYFILNPKNRNNSEANRETIINQSNGQVVPSEWKNFGGVTDTWTEDSNGQRVLRVLAGEELNIGIELFEQLKTDGKAKLTIDIDFAVRNITKEDESVIDICQDSTINNSVTGIQTTETYGLRMLPLTGYVKCVGRQATNDQDFGWEEGERTYLSLVIDPEVTAKASDELTWQKTLNDNPSKALSLAKVYINGTPQREVDYTPNAGAWISGDGHGGIRIGNDNCDIDIYGIRCYRTSLSAQSVQQNCIAAKPTAEEKLSMKVRNAITNNGRIDYDKTVKAGYRTLTWVGQDQYKLNQDKNGYPGYWDIRHDNPSLSGTIGKAAYMAYVEGTLGTDKCLLITPQGSTANTYWDNNGQTKCDGVTYKITIPFSKVHPDFGWNSGKSDFTEDSPASYPMTLDGVQIQGTSYASLSDEEKSRVMITVPDGWFDGNGWSEVQSECGMYHGQFYTSYIGGSKCTKLVNKINVASPMQSHKMGATRLYNDVMVKVTGGMKLHQDNPSVRFSVYEDSFLYFNANPADNGKIEFRGLCTFGNGKFDKPTFGYSSNKKTFAFEGLNNNLPLCDFRVPADEKVVYSPDDEAWSYAGTKSFEYGLGATKKVNGRKYPTDENDLIFRRYVNFIYCHNTRISHYNGTKEAFMQSWEILVGQAASDSNAALKVADMKNISYWFTQGANAYNLVRYDFDSEEWVDAGTWAQDTLSYSSGIRNLSTDGMTSDAFLQWKNGEDYGNFVILNTAFRSAIASHASKYFGTVAGVKNHLTHYNLVNFLYAGTDNCSKNTYYQVDPDTGLVWLDQDDLDSILKTDNNGRQTKVYFLDRIHDEQDFADGYKPQMDYEGRASTLFNMIEDAYETYGSELRQNMREVLSAMSSLVTTTDPYEVSVWGCMEKYFFSIQKYFPEISYAEQARLRYEWPKSFGYISYGNQARGVDPITQQVGSQIESERQYMKRRLALVSSYACWGDFSAGINTGVVGLSDSGSALSLSPGSGRVGSDYTFEVVPHQWLYPTGAKDRVAVDPHVRVAPGESYTFTVAKSGEISGDSSVSLAALNYYRKIGNVGNMTVGNNTLSVGANRLTDFTAEPSEGSLFTPGAIDLKTPNLQRLSLKGCSTQSGTKDFTNLTRIESINLSMTAVTVPVLPKSFKLWHLGLPSTTTSLVLEGLPSLREVTFDGFTALKELTIDSSVPADTGRLVKDIWESGNSIMTKLHVENVKWTSVSSSMVTWMLDIPIWHTSGSIELIAQDDLPYKDVIRLIDKYGDIQSEENMLYVSYKKNPINSIAVTGDKYIGNTGLWDGWGISVAPNKGNSVAIKDGRENVRWELSGDGISAYAEIVDNVKGTVNVKKVDTAIYPQKFTLSVTMTLVDGSELKYTKTIGFARRVPSVGDFAYHDGTFDDEADASKDLVGVVVKRDVEEWYDDSMTIPKKCKLWVYAKENAVVTSADMEYSTSSLAWGLYPDSGPSGFPSDFGAEVAEAAGLSSAFDTKMTNITTSGLQSPTDSTNFDYRNITSDTFLDANEDDGFAKFAESRSLGDFESEYKTGVIIDHAKAIISGYLGESYPQTRTELADNMQALVSKMTDEGVSNPSRYRQLYYPAAYSCYLYEPSVSDGRVLNEQYSKTRWMLPSCGLLARIYNFYYNSCGRVTYEKGGRISVKFANENPASEALLPLFSNMIKRIGSTAGLAFSYPTNTHYWSSTEYSSGVAWHVYFGSGNVGFYNKSLGLVSRAVSAFTFEL